MMRMLWLVLMGLLCTVPAYAANHFVVPSGGGGAGTSWTNACNDFTGSCANASLVRGDTYYVADGTYACRAFSKAASGTSIITIKKATVSDHGGNETGWVNTMGDGQAIFSGTDGCLEFNTDYWTFDGVVGGGPGSWKTGHGFSLQTSNHSCSNCSMIRFNWSGGGGIDHIIIKHVEAGMSVLGGSNGCDSTGPCTNIIYMAGGADSTFSYNYFHESDGFALILGTGWRNVIWEYNYLEDANRKEMISCQDACNLTYRYNMAHNAAGTGWIVAIANPANTPFNWFIYGNIFYTDDASFSMNDCLFCTNENFGQTSHDIYIYNNTFVNLRGASDVNFESCTSNCLVKNNLFYTSVGTTYAVTSGNTHDYNWCYASSGSCTSIAAETNDQVGTGNPFVNLASENFQLSANTTAGTNLGSPYNVDMTGATRSTWTRGALEFGSADVTPPSAPTDLMVD